MERDAAMSKSNADPLRCANCGKKLPAIEFRNVDGEPCCQVCWDMEEEKLEKEH
jgi:formylmethanofuran dehydrogenase subunit E